MKAKFYFPCGKCFEVVERSSCREVTTCFKCRQTQLEIRRKERMAERKLQRAIMRGEEVIHSPEVTD